MYCRLTKLRLRQVLLNRRAYSSAGSRKTSIEILDKTHPTDSVTNISPLILSQISARLHLQPSHPLSSLRGLIESHLSDFECFSSLSPVVTPHKNFDELDFPIDHPGRSVNDSYYINKDLMLRTHTSTHEVEIFAQDIPRWLLTADVYRRDEIDRSHYPIFHQVEGAKVIQAGPSGIAEMKAENERLLQQLHHSNIVIEDIPNITSSNPCQSLHDPAHTEVVAQNLKLTLNHLILKLFGVSANTNTGPLRVRWIEASFPFTSPSYEVEVFFGGKWLEILGCGVVKQSTLERASMFLIHHEQKPVVNRNLSEVPEKIGWAFGIGLERVAMILLSIPDIRLFWSKDPRFLAQFSEGRLGTFKPYSAYPPCYKDVSFWTDPEQKVHENDLCDLVRDIAGDVVESVQRVHILLLRASPLTYSKQWMS